MQHSFQIVPTFQRRDRSIDILFNVMNNAYLPGPIVAGTTPFDSSKTYDASGVRLYRDFPVLRPAIDNPAALVCVFGRIIDPQKQIWLNTPSNVRDDLLACR